jgi:nucleoside-diphosphate-sugar epimerase
MVNSQEEKSLVLVTGGSGFTAAYCIIKCLASNYRVRTTVRSLNRENGIRNILTAGNATNLDDLSFAKADLMKDEGWNEAVEGCSYVLHLASPFPLSTPKDENDLIRPAREGTLRVLRAARDAGVKRVVVTSSFAAIGYGHRSWDPSKIYTENDWSDTSSPIITTYAKSKTLAERAAWEFIEKEGGNLELTVINPVSIFGPLVDPDFSSSVEVVHRLMNGALPGCPDLSWNIVDVRDVADLHVLAMTNPKANGERLLCVSPPSMKIKEMSQILHERLGAAAKRSPTRNLPNFVVKLNAWFDPAIAMVVPDLGKVKILSNEKAKSLLGWQPRSNVDALVATAESLIKLGLVKS